MKNLWKKMAVAVALSVAVSAVMAPSVGSYAQEQEAPQQEEGEKYPNPADGLSATDQSNPANAPAGTEGGEPADTSSADPAQADGQGATAQDPAQAGTDPSGMTEGIEPPGQQSSTGPEDTNQAGPVEEGRAGILELDGGSVLQRGKNVSDYILLKNWDDKGNMATFMVPAGVEVHGDAKIILRQDVDTAIQEIQHEDIIITGSALTGTTCQFDIKVSWFTNDTYYAELQDGTGALCKSEPIKVEVKKPYTKTKSLNLGNNLSISKVRGWVEAYFGETVKAGEIIKTDKKEDKVDITDKKIKTKKYGKEAIVIAIKGTGVNKEKTLGTMNLTVKPKKLKLKFINGKKTYEGYKDYDIKRIQIENIDTDKLEKGHKIKISFKKRGSNKDTLLKDVSVAETKPGSGIYVSDDIAIKKGIKWTFTVTVEYKGYGKWSGDAPWPK